MSRLIDADKLMSQVVKKKPEVAKARYTEGFNDAIMRVRSMIHSAPAVDIAEVVHAYWKETTHITISPNFREIHSKLYNCSNCDAPNGRKKSRYCHWCGAKMDGK